MRYVCKSCGVEKDSTEFYADKRNILKGVRADCKECFKAYRRAHPTLYTPERREYAKQWREDNIEHCRELERAKRERNAESYRAAVLKWSHANPEVKRLRRIAERTSVPAWAELDKIDEVYSKAKEWGFEVDHVVPLQHPLVCGLHVWHNLQVLDRYHNRAKCNSYWPDMPEPTALPAAKLVALTT